jgi:purine-binding chemotaxis protein CheW
VSEILNAKIAESEDQMGRYLSFSLGSEEYAIPLLSVKEVVAVPEITPIPFTPSYFLGIMSLRGQVISVIDLRSKLNIKPSSSAETAIVICELNSIFLGVVVDSVNSVITPKESELSPKPEIQGSRATDYITNVFRKEKRLILFLDVSKVLTSEDHSQISRSTSKLKAA